MRKSSSIQEVAKYISERTPEGISKLFLEIERVNGVVEKMEVDANTYMMFRSFPPSIIEFASLRDARKGLFARIWTAEIWLNNNLKEGQIKFFYSTIEREKEPEREDARP